MMGIGEPWPAACQRRQREPGRRGTHRQERPDGSRPSCRRAFVVCLHAVVVCLLGTFVVPFGGREYARPQQLSTLRRQYRIWHFWVSKAERRGRNPKNEISLMKSKC